MVFIFVYTDNYFDAAVVRIFIWIHQNEIWNDLFNRSSCATQFCNCNCNWHIGGIFGATNYLSS